MQPAHTGIERGYQLRRGVHDPGELPDALRHSSRCDLAESGEDGDAELRLAHRIGDALHDGRPDGRADDHLRVDIPRAVLPLGHDPSVLDELGVAHGSKVRPRRDPGLHLGNELVEHRLLAVAEDPGEGRAESRRALVVVVARILDVLRDGWVLAEEAHVDRVGGEPRHAVAEDSADAHLVVEVAAPRAVGLGLSPEELVLLERAEVDPPPRRAGHDALLPGQRPVERGEGIGPYLVGIAAREDGEALGRLRVGDPTVHGDSLAQFGDVPAGGGWWWVVGGRRWVEG
ncbi:unannotated protein [freshwater metagenome]|uniref:Unannotated protein n=1 Tax=freshwater metagenome TaxID=449393 RepID=A0A6J7MED4_9ZZZZ